MRLQLMTECIFCNIATGNSPAFIIRENEEFVAFFDIFPSTKGQTLVIPKQHYASDLFLIEDGAFYQRYLLATKAVVDLLKKGLGVHRVAMVMEGLSVPHLHLKLYPLYPDVRFSIDSGEKADEEALKALQAQVLE